MWSIATCSLGASVVAENPPLSHHYRVPIAPAHLQLGFNG